MKSKDRDLEFMSDKAAAMLLQAPRSSKVILWLTVLFFVVLMAWAAWAEIDKVVPGIGVVVPSSHVQIVQNLEGGIVTDILVKNGDVVEKGQVLIRLDDTRFASELRKAKENYHSLLQRAARLKVEATGQMAQLQGEEQKLLKEHLRQLENSRKLLQAEQKRYKQRLTEALVRKDYLKRRLDLKLRELKMAKPLEKSGAFTKVDMLRLKGQANQLEGDLKSVKASIPRLEAALDAETRRLRELELNFRTKARENLKEVSDRLMQIKETIVSVADRVRRTDVRAPLRGVVQQVNITTIGGVVQPGMELLKIVPIDDDLLIDTSILAKDIGFIKIGQEAMIRFTAYDFTVYGGMNGRVEQISADSINDEKNKGSYYLVKIRPERNFVADNLYIIPGMQANIDIKIGKRTVLDYLLNPLLRVKHKAFSE